jgi:hypothetical protein
VRTDREGQPYLHREVQSYLHFWHYNSIVRDNLGMGGQSERVSSLTCNTGTICLHYHHIICCQLDWDVLFVKIGCGGNNIVYRSVFGTSIHCEQYIYCRVYCLLCLVNPAI